MDALTRHPLLAAAVLLLLVLWRAPLWGSRVLDFLCDLHAYRAERRRR